MNNLSNIVNNQVERYIRETLKDKEGLLKELEEYAAEYNVPIVHKEVSDLLKVLLKFLSNYYYHKYHPNSPSTFYHS